MTERQDTGRVAIITGAGRGIGYGIAEALVPRGDRVCVTGRDEDALKDAVDRLGADRAIGVADKAHDEAHQAEAVERTMEASGRVDHLADNAGTNPVFGPTADVALATARKVFETNVISALGFARRTWQRQGWTDRDPTIGIERRPAPPDRTKALAENQITALWRLDVALREKTFRKDAQRVGSAGRRGAVPGSIRW